MRYDNKRVYAQNKKEDDCMLAKRMLAAAAAICTAGTLLTALPNSVFAGQLLGQTDFSDGVGLPWHVCESATDRKSVV